MTCFRYDDIDDDLGVCNTTLVCFYFALGILQLQSDWSLSCDHGLDYAS